MRLFLGLMFFVLAVTILTGSYSAPVAQTMTPPHDCEKTQTTADVMACVKKNHDAAQARLNTLFQKMTDILDEESLVSFRTAQKDWIVYRNQECQWETDRFSEESLKRIDEMNCLTRLTEERADTLSYLLNEKEEKISDNIAPFPRWINVLAQENPDIYWKYGTRLKTDLNCDGFSEEVLSGIKIQSGKNGNITRPIVAIVQNPPTGKPLTRLVDFDISPEQDPGSVCDTKISLSEIIDKSETDTPESETTCRRALKIDHGDCTPLIIFSDGVDYQRNFQPQWNRPSSGP